MMNDSQFEALVRELTALNRETGWVEFKHNKAVPEEIGEYVSALSNSSALLGKPSAYILWGVEDGTKRIIGTTFRPYLKKIGNEELENWLLTQLDPRIQAASDWELKNRAIPWLHGLSVKPLMPV